MPQTYAVIQGMSDALGNTIRIDPSANALRVTPRPLDVLGGGEYSLLVSTGTMAAGLAGAAPIFSFRWHGPGVALLQNLRIAMMSLGTGFAAGVGFFDLIAARAFTASDTGGTAPTLTGNNAKKRTAFASTQVADLRISSTATLSAGTRTLDANALTGVRFGVTTPINTIQLPTTTLFQGDNERKWPFVMGTDEGFVIRATVPATGTWQADIQIEWDELPAF